MKNKYVVRTQGEVKEVRLKNHTYVFQADTPEKATELARTAFVEEFGSFDDFVYSEVLYTRNSKVIIGIICMIVAIGLSYIGWTTKTGHEKIYFSPNLTTIMYASIFYAAFIFRFKGIVKALETATDIVFIVLNILLLSGLFGIFLTQTNFQFLWMTTSIKSDYVIILGIILSWLGLKSVSAICLLLTLVLGLANLSTISDAMDKGWGSLYGISAFVGMLCYLSVEPSIIDSFPYYKKYISKGLRASKENISALGKSSTKIVKKTSTNVRSKKKGRKWNVFY